ncbi:2Fe-2S iron-sulfur cluster binding domain-containing protein [Pseudonocardia sp. C8]|uniref:2Fe-2S iron-sulfur cluster-binding protein n=1 Tax=Pseudonocardia sp. C8 TaxID=2762759 RepID=UPI001643282E|nr:2Fe-2S iron-sulfur cluster binding domain-containing protein [Pseudonocardia sp. C8]
MPAYDITVRNRDGRVVRVDADRFLLDELEAAGLRLPHGCRFGACLTCAATIIEGTVDQSQGRSYALRPEQEADGYVLLCVARPRSDCVVEVGVRRDLYVNPFRHGGRRRGVSCTEL